MKKFFSFKNVLFVSMNMWMLTMALLFVWSYFLPDNLLGWFGLAAIGYLLLEPIAKCNVKNVKDICDHKMYVMVDDEEK